MGVGKGAVVEELIERAGGCAVIDGGFATQLEREGADIADPLWSAVCLVSNPDLIRKVSLPPGLFSKFEGFVLLMEVEKTDQPVFMDSFANFLRFTGQLYASNACVFLFLCLCSGS